MAEVVQDQAGEHDDLGQGYGRKPAGDEWR